MARALLQRVSTKGDNNMSDKTKNVKRKVRTLAARDLMKATGGKGAATKFPGTLGFVPTSPTFGALGMLPHGPTRHPHRPVLGFFPSHPKKPVLGFVPTK
jgi:hypothetical protein